MIRRLRLLLPGERCRCCGRRFDLRSRQHGTVWYSIGSGYSVCHRHGDYPSWPVKKWEHDNTTEVYSLPMSWWHPGSREGWVMNHPRIAFVLKMPIPLGALWEHTA